VGFTSGNGCNPLKGPYPRRVGVSHTIAVTKLSIPTSAPRVHVTIPTQGQGEAPATHNLPATIHTPNSQPKLQMLHTHTPDGSILMLMEMVQERESRTWGRHLPIQAENAAVRNEYTESRGSTTYQR
jgi:hypothetical protein